MLLVNHVGVLSTYALNLSQDKAAAQSQPTLVRQCLTLESMKYQ